MQYVPDISYTLPGNTLSYNCEKGRDSLLGNQYPIDTSTISSASLSIALQLRTLLAMDSTKKIPEKWQAIVKILLTEKWKRGMKKRKGSSGTSVNLIYDQKGQGVKE